MSKEKDTKSRCQAYPGVRRRVTRTGPGSSLTFQPPGSATPARYRPRHPDDLILKMTSLFLCAPGSSDGDPRPHPALPGPYGLCPRRQVFFLIENRKKKSCQLQGSTSSGPCGPWAAVCPRWSRGPCSSPWWRGQGRSWPSWRPASSWPACSWVWCPGPRHSMSSWQVRCPDYVLMSCPCHGSHLPGGRVPRRPRHRLQLPGGGHAGTSEGASLHPGKQTLYYN